MNTALEELLFLLTKKRNLTEISVDELSYLANTYPYFAPAQLALSRKLKDVDQTAYLAQLPKTALYFPNNGWLKYQLEDGQTKQITILNAHQPTIERPEVAIPNPKITIATTKNAIDNLSTPTAEAQGMDLTPYFSPNEGLQALDEMKPPIAPILAINELSDPLPSNTLNNPISSNEEKQAAKFSSVLANQLADFKKPIDQDAKLDIEVEPFYTVDYFASQGIKADLSQLPQDKLTKHLLTFTDWLKKMKQVTPDAQDQLIDPELDATIQNIAKSSNEIKEIATETMAEIFVKQGKIHKAIQLYIKLSFLDPEKSSYFASKIEQLKGM